MFIFKKYTHPAPIQSKHSHSDKDSWSDWEGRSQAKYHQVQIILGWLSAIADSL